ncbi:MAG: hypothetical protein ACI94Y_000527 [Maribacter sp.]|jgi:hypothetical protein
MSDKQLKEVILKIDNRNTPYIIYEILSKSYTYTLVFCQKRQ